METIDCAIIGAGPAGLAQSAALAVRGVEHVVLERNRAAHSWRSQRWDAFQLNTPGWMNTLLGHQDPHHYATRSEIISSLDRIARAAPTREGVEVSGLEPADRYFELHTSDGGLQARAVVVATGDQNVPRRPPLADRLPSHITQLHAAE